MSGDPGGAPPEVDRWIRQTLHVERSSPPPPSYSAAVLTLLRPSDRGLEAFFIQRAERPTDPWSGQVAFPGGRRDPIDADSRATALREAREEVGLEASALVSPPFHLATLQPSTRPQMSVSAYLAVLANDGSGLAPVSEEEVAEVFWAPLPELSARRAPPAEFGGRWPRYPGYVYQGRWIWGFSARVLVELWSRAPALRGAADPKRAR